VILYLILGNFWYKKGDILKKLNKKESRSDLTIKKRTPLISGTTIDKKKSHPAGGLEKRIMRNHDSLIS